MKYGICSDLHLGHYGASIQERLAEKINATKCDVVLIAGDIDESPILTASWLAKLRKPYRTIPGNHDFYWVPMVNDPYEDEIYDLVAATLWTNFWNNPLAAMQAQISIPDFKNIKKPNGELINSMDMEKMFFDDLIFIQNSDMPVVMTHWPPSLGSLHPTKEGHQINPYFVNDIHEIKLQYMGKKLWVHGHTHDQFDYMIGDLRVVCNPFGYPRERAAWGQHVEDYQIKVVEI